MSEITGQATMSAVNLFCLRLEMYASTAAEIAETNAKAGAATALRFAATKLEVCETLRSISRYVGEAAMGEDEAELAVLVETQVFPELAIAARNLDPEANQSVVIAVGRALAFANGRRY